MAQTYKTLMSQTSSVALQKESATTSVKTNKENIKIKMCASCFTEVAIQNRHIMLK